MGSWRRGLGGVCKEVGRTEKGRGGTPPFGELVQKLKSSSFSVFSVEVVLSLHSIF